MADFSFDTTDEIGGTGNAPSGTTDGGPGTSDGAKSATDGSSGTESNASDFDGSGSIPKKKRGRKAYPRDAEGRPIRPDGTTGPRSATDKSKSEGLDLGGKVHNNRALVAKNLGGFLAMFALFAKEPIWNLKPDEAQALSESLCAVADYHQIDLMGAGGPITLYISLAATSYMIFAPRVMYIKMKNVTPPSEMPPTPGEARASAEARRSTMDFSGDVASTVN